MFRGLLFMWKFAWKTEKSYLCIRILQQLVSAIALLANVTMPKFIIDELAGAQRVDRLLFLAGGYLLALLIANSLSSYLLLAGFNGRIRVSNAYTLFLHEKLARADYEQMQSPRFMELKTRAEKFLTADWHGNFYLLDEALSVIGQTFTLAGVAAIVFTLDPVVALVLCALILVQVAVDARAKNREIDISLRTAACERQHRYYTNLFEGAEYAKEIRVNALGDWLLAREKASLDAGAALYRKRNALYIKSGIAGAANTFLQQSVAYAYVIYRTLAGQIGIGDFYLYTNAVSTFSASMRAAIGSLVWIKSYGKYYDALDEYLNIPETVRAGECPLPKKPYAFVLDDVGYRYPGQDTWALRHVNLTIAPGEKLSVVGENGAGKTTFIKLLMRLYDPTEGRITMNGTDIRALDYDAYMSAFGAVFQDFQLFAFTLGENVSLSDAGHARDRDIEAALGRAGLSGRLSTLPDGLQTIVSRQLDAPAEWSSVFRRKESTGFEPSGGEAQKIALARALYRDAPVVLLDEPTAALDPRAEYEMVRRFDTMVAGKTAIYVSHRLSSARFCDRIAVFQGGAIVELGTHGALMAKNGKYAELYQMQAQYYIE